MHIVHVLVHVKPDMVEAFREATLVNAASSRRTESGVARFDVLQQQDDPTRFVLVEVYDRPEDAAKHKDTPHYLKWRDTVSPMMAEARSGLKYTNLFPGDDGWRQTAVPLHEIAARHRPTRIRVVDLGKP